MLLITWLKFRKPSHFCPDSTAWTCSSSAVQLQPKNPLLLFFIPAFISNCLLLSNKAYYIHCNTFPQFYQLISKHWTHLKHIYCRKSISNTQCTVILPNTACKTSQVPTYSYWSAPHLWQSHSPTSSTSPQMEEQTRGTKKTEILKHKTAIQREIPPKISCKYTQELQKVKYQIKVK